MILQVTVASSEGIDPSQLALVLGRYYRLPSGHRCRAVLGQGQHLDGIPQNFVVLEREEMQ